jgi:hypothetical protein
MLNDKDKEWLYYMSKELIIGRGQLSQDISDMSVSRKHVVMTKSNNPERPFHLKVADTRKKLWINGLQTFESDVAPTDKVQLGDNRITLNMESAVQDFEHPERIQVKKTVEEVKQTTVSGSYTRRLSEDDKSQSESSSPSKNAESKKAPEPSMPPQTTVSTDVSQSSASESVIKKGKEVIEVKPQTAPQQEDYSPLDFKNPKLDNLLNLLTIIILLCFFVIAFFYIDNLAVMIGWLVLALATLLLRLKFKLYK